MNIALRPAKERGYANHGWLDTWHSFSFADYFDPKHMGFRDLRVINDDTVAPAAGFPTHGHKDMEIITYVIRGALAHKDSTGGQGVVKRGDVQTMSAGTGVRHSEFNASENEDVRLLQIWVMPQQDGITPGYAQAHFSDDEKRNRLRLVASNDTAGGALPIRQDAKIYASILEAGKTLDHTVGKERGVWIQMVEGAIDVNGTAMKSGDGAAIEQADKLHITARQDSEFLLFDLV